MKKEFLIYVQFLTNNLIIYIITGPNWLPWVGNSLELRKTSRELNGLHNVFKKWMFDYDSPVLGLKLGNEYVVVALTYPMVRAVHTDTVYDGRPDNFHIQLRTMGTR